MLGVGHEVNHDLLQLLAEAQYRLGALIHARAYFDVVGAEHSLPDLRDVTDQLVELNPHGRGVGAARQAQQAPHDAGGAIHLAYDRRGGGAGLGVLGRSAQQLRLHANRGERVVDLVGHTTRDLADCGQLLARNELALRAQLVGPVIQRDQQVLRSEAA